MQIRKAIKDNINQYNFQIHFQRELGTSVDTRSDI